MVPTISLTFSPGDLRVAMVSKSKCFAGALGNGAIEWYRSNPKA